MRAGGAEGVGGGGGEADPEAAAFILKHGLHIEDDTDHHEDDQIGKMSLM